MHFKHYNPTKIFIHYIEYLHYIEGQSVILFNKKK